MSRNASPPSLSHVEDSHPLTVLVADDDPAVVRLVTRIAEGAGFVVQQACDGLEAFEAVVTDAPGILVTDWNMPGLDGAALCRRLRQHNLPHFTYIVMLTAKSQADDVVEGLEAGADDYVVKPIHPGILVARLHAATRTVIRERNLRGLAKSDYLTGVLNRRAFLERVTEHWNRSTRHQGPLACAMIDIDYFKRVNDALGHAVGDSAIQVVARALQAELRSCDHLARYGGEEFCALLPETTEAGAARWAERARRRVAQSVLQDGAQDVRLTVSLGVAERLADTESPEALIELADQALRVAKEAGRNRVVRFTATCDSLPDTAGKKSLHGALRDVLARHVMSPVTYCPEAGQSTERVADAFLQLGLDAAPVVNGDGMLLGMISEADLLAATASEVAWDSTIDQCVRGNVVRFEEATPAREIMQFLARASVPRVVVVRAGRPTGVISRATLLRWFRNQLAQQPPRASGSPCAATADADTERRAGIIRAADLAAERVAQLRQHVSDPTADFRPAAIGETSRLEGLLTNILALCRWE